MNRKNNATFQMLMHMVDFLVASVSQLPKSSGASTLLKTLESGVKNLSDLAGIWEASAAAARQGKAKKDAARESYKTYLLQAASVSRVMHIEAVRLPASPTDLDLLNAGKGFLQVADSMKKDLVDHGLPAKFADDLASAMQNFEKKTLACREARGRRSPSLQKWNVQMEESLETLRHLDVLVSNAQGNDPAFMAAYDAARIIRYVASRKVAEASPQAPEPAAVPPVPAVATGTAA